MRYNLQHLKFQSVFLSLRSSTASNALVKPDVRKFQTFNSGCLTTSAYNFIFTDHTAKTGHQIGLFRTMADDASYNTFLTRANQDPSSGHSSEGHSTSQARSQFDPSSTSSSNSAVPASLRDLKASYTSDMDSDFEPVFFSYASDDLPSTEDFRKALGVKGDNAGKVEELSVKEFDPRGQYGEIIGKVGEAGVEARGKRGAGAADAAVKIFRVELDGTGTRIEYYIVSVGERSLVGVLAKAVES